MKISVTGHRDCSAKSTEIIDILVALFKRLKPEIVNTGMAIGLDTYAAIASIEAEVPFKAFIPFKGQEGKWPKEAQEVYHALLAAAKEQEIVSPGAFEAWKMHARNERLVQEASLMVAYLDPSQTTGGTLACVTRANEKKVPVVNIFTLVQKYSACTTPEEKVDFLTKLKSRI